MSKAYPQIPQHELDALARVMLPAIQEYFQSAEGKEEFEAWEQAQKAQGKHPKQ